MSEDKKSQDRSHYPIPIVIIAVLILTVLAFGLGVSFSPDVMLALKGSMLLANLVALGAWLFLS